MDVGNSTAYNFTDEGVNELEGGTIYYVMVVPYNDEGSAEGCSGISFTTETLATVPDCTTIISPADGATDVPVDASITWEAVPGADGYRIFISMVPDDTDIIDVGITPDTSFDLPTDLDENTTYYVRIVPFNTVGDAVGCVETSFTTEQAAMTGLSFEDGSFVYYGTEHSLAISGTLPPGASVDYTDNGRIDVGVQTVTVTVTAPNYQTFIATADLAITPASLIVRANSHAKLFGSSDPVLDYTVEGLAAQDVLIGSLSRETGEDEGEYTILQSTLTAGANYDIEFTPGILTIYRGVDVVYVPHGPLEVYGEEQLPVNIHVQHIWTETYGTEDEVMLRLEIGDGLTIVDVESADLEIFQQYDVWLLRPINTWNPSEMRQLEITVAGNGAYEGSSHLRVEVWNPENVSAQGDASLRLYVEIEQGIAELVIPNVFTPNWRRDQ